MNKKMKYTSKNGYTGVMYGESSFVVLNKDGEEVMHTGSRAFNTYEELIKQVEAFPEFWAMLEEVFKKEEFNNTWYIGDFNAIGKVRPIAWMLLPEPPEEEEK